MSSIRPWQFYVYMILMALTFFMCLRGDRWFSIVDSANLAFHEFGHPFFGLFSTRLMVYGGTLGQLMFPVGTSFYFWRHQDTFRMSITLLWVGENLFNIATYMRDARAQQLPLVGGGEHDWTEIFTRWGCLQSDVKISDHLIKLTVIALCVLGYYLFNKKEEAY